MQACTNIIASARLRPVEVKKIPTIPIPSKIYFVRSTKPLKAFEI